MEHDEHNEHAEQIVTVVAPEQPPTCDGCGLVRRTDAEAEAALARACVHEGHRLAAAVNKIK